MELEAGIVVIGGGRVGEKDLCDLLETGRKMVRGRKTAVDGLLQSWA